jgi:hypothetical protein
MAGEQDQLPFDEGVQRGERAQRERSNRQAEVAGRRGGGDDVLQRPSLNLGLNMGLDLVPDPAKRPKTGVDSE